MLLEHLDTFMRKFWLQKVIAFWLRLQQSKKDLRGESTGNIDAAKKVGALIAERAKAAGVTNVAFDRSGYKYHGRVKALADAAREGGLEF